MDDDDDRNCRGGSLGGLKNTARESEREPEPVEIRQFSQPSFSSVSYENETQRVARAPSVLRVCAKFQRVWIARGKLIREPKNGGRRLFIYHFTTHFFFRLKSISNERHFLVCERNGTEKNACP